MSPERAAKMRSGHLWGHIVAAACAAVGGTASVVGVGVAGCGTEPSLSSCGDDSGSSGESGSADGSQSPDSDATGAVKVMGTFTNTVCPTVNPIGIGPDNGGSVSLMATINGSASDGGAPTITWSSTSGTFSDPHAADTTFLCAAPGVVTVTVKATIAAAGCDQGASGTITCH